MSVQKGKHDSPTYACWSGIWRPVTAAADRIADSSRNRTRDALVNIVVKWTRAGPFEDVDKEGDRNEDLLRAGKLES